MEATVQYTWKPAVAGILNIISGALNVLGAIGLIIVITSSEIWTFLLRVIPPEDLPFIVPLLNAILIILLVLSVIQTICPVIGGVFAIQRRRWGLALAGSIIAIFGALPLGVASTIFVAMAKDEFDQPKALL